MDSNKEYLDIDELARRIEERIKELEGNKEESKKEVIVNKNGKLSDLDIILNELDKRIQELDEESINELDVDLLMNKINEKLSRDEDDNNKIYDLDEITKALNETIKALEEKRKRKKEQKARYCDIARHEKKY